MVATCYTPATMDIMNTTIILTALVWLVAAGRSMRANRLPRLRDGSLLGQRRR